MAHVHHIRKVVADRLSSNEAQYNAEEMCGEPLQDVKEHWHPTECYTDPLPDGLAIDLVR